MALLMPAVREDLAHTGAHKINNAIGQALLAQRLGKKRIIAEVRLYALLHIIDVYKGSFD